MRSQGRSTIRKALFVGAALVATATAAFAGSAPASADPDDLAHGMLKGCAWPKVCFYKTWNDWDNNDPTAAYKDKGWQTLGSRSKGSVAVYNSRRDDAALLKLDDGSNYCLEPGFTMFFSGNTPGQIVKKINIISSPSC